MRSHPAAGQATVEYVAAIALVAAVFLVAAPAVGAPSIAHAVVAQVKHALCMLTGDFCTVSDARAAGLAPCPLRSRTTGVDGAVTVLFVEAGGRSTLGVTPLSDGTVSVVRTLGGSLGAVAGAFGVDAGPLRVEGGPEVAARRREQGSIGWVFPDRATAGRFLEHSVRNVLDGDRFPWAWRSDESAAEVAAALGVSAGSGKAATGNLATISFGLAGADGHKRFRDGSLTTYTRVTIDGPEVSVPLLAPVTTRGRNEWLAELTRGPGGEARELVLRRAVTEPGGSRIRETIARLDLRVPENLAIARPLVDGPMPRSFGAGAAAVLERIATHGIVERLVSTIQDGSRGGAVSVKAGLKFSVAAKRVQVVRRLVAATASVAGGVAGRRLDCLPRAP